MERAVHPTPSRISDVLSAFCLATLGEGVAVALFLTMLALWCGHRERPHMSPRIVTTLVYPPIPIRSMDWQAHYAGEEDEQMATGHGVTEAEAGERLSR
jgi:hypothetical protein